MPRQTKPALDMNARIFLQFLQDHRGHKANQRLQAKLARTLQKIPTAESGTGKHFELQRKTFNYSWIKRLNLQSLLKKQVVVS